MGTNGVSYHGAKYGIIIKRRFRILENIRKDTKVNRKAQVIFQNIITYLDRTFKMEQNDIDFKMK